MDIKGKLLLYYSTILALFITVSGFIVSGNNPTLIGLQLIFFPVTLYLLYATILSLFGRKGESTIWSKLVIYYDFVLISIMIAMGFLSANSIPQIISAFIFFPLFIYFLLLVIPKRSKALSIPKSRSEASAIPKFAVVKEKPISYPKQAPIKLKRDFDMDRRMFLKLIGSAGISIFLISIFTRKAHAAFFGSVPGPGTVALKDTTGAQIDPSQHHPTDGYKITEIDDSSPAFYGFVRKDGAWFIMKEGTGGDYRYTKGSSGFTNGTTGWPNRANLTYDYFDAVF